MDENKKQIVMSVSLIINAALVIDVTDINKTLIEVVGQPQLMRNFLADSLHDLTPDQKRVLLDAVLMAVAEAGVSELAKNLEGSDYRRASSKDLIVTKASA